MLRDKDAKPSERIAAIGNLFPDQRPFGSYWLGEVGDCNFLSGIIQSRATWLCICVGMQMQQVEEWLEKLGLSEYA
jgi:hypothetical protein